MPQSTSEELKQQWTENILKQRQSKLSIADWCSQNKIAVQTFYYWQKKIFPKPNLDRSAFIEVAEENNTFVNGISIEYKGFSIRINEHFNPSILKRCLEVLIKC